MDKKFLGIGFGNHNINIQYFESQSEEPGPHLVITGGMHGDELNGVLVVDEFLQWVLDNEIESELKGKITIIPILNPSGFEKMQRYVPEDNKDLNRCFMIQQPTSITEEIANVLMKEIYAKCDFALDFHDAGQKSILLPHTRVHKNDEYQTLMLAQVFGTKLIVERDGKENMLAVAVKEQFNKPVVTIEIGGGSKREPKYIKEGIQGIINVLSFYAMIKARIKLPDHQYYLNQRFGMYAKNAAYIDLYIELGEFVHVNQKMGKMVYLQERRELELKAPMCGLVFTLAQKQQLAKSELIYSILETKECHIERTTSDKVTELPELKLKKIRM